MAFVATAEDIVAVPLFGSLSDDQLAELATWFHVQNASDGVRLVGEGAHGYTFFILTEGTATVTSDGESLATSGRATSLARSRFSEKDGAPPP